MARSLGGGIDVLTELGLVCLPLRAVVDETERRCLVFTLVTGAGVCCEMRWIRRSPRT